jgi:hypothetical protein
MSTDMRMPTTVQSLLRSIGIACHVASGQSIRELPGADTQLAMGRRWLMDNAWLANRVVQVIDVAMEAPEGATQRTRHILDCSGSGFMDDLSSVSPGYLKELFNAAVKLPEGEFMRVMNILRAAIVGALED